MILLVFHHPHFLITSCIHVFENYVQSVVLHDLRPDTPFSGRLGTAIIAEIQDEVREIMEQHTDLNTASSNVRTDKQE